MLGRRLKERVGVIKSNLGSMGIDHELEQRNHSSHLGVLPFIVALRVLLLSSRYFRCEQRDYSLT